MNLNYLYVREKKNAYMVSMIHSRDLIEKWTEKASTLRWLHDSSHRYYKRSNNRYYFISIFFSTMTGIGGFWVASMHSYFAYVLASLNIVSGLIYSFQMFSRAAEKGEAHANASRQYASFVRNLKMENMDISDEEFVGVVKYIKHDYERLCSTSPEVPKPIFNFLKKRCDDSPDSCNTDTEPKPNNLLRIFMNAFRVSSFFPEPAGSSTASNFVDPHV